MKAAFARSLTEQMNTEINEIMILFIIDFMKFIE